MIKKLTGAVALSLMATTALAGGVERSNQSVAAIFAEGNNITFSFGSVRPNVTGNLAANGSVSGDMGGDYSTQQMMDIVFTVGQYNLVSMALNSFGVQLDDGLPGWDV